MNNNLTARYIDIKSSNSVPFEIHNTDSTIPTIFIRIYDVNNVMRHMLRFGNDGHLTYASKDASGNVIVEKQLAWVIISATHYMAQGTIKKLNAENNLVTASNITSYTQNNMFEIPSDGYIEVSTSYSGSSVAYAVIYGANKTQTIQIGGHSNNTYSRWATFVKKGMFCYAKDIANNGAVYYYPLS